MLEKVCINCQKDLYNEFYQLKRCLNCQAIIDAKTLHYQLRGVGEKCRYLCSDCGGVHSEPKDDDMPTDPLLKIINDAFKRHNFPAELAEEFTSEGISLITCFILHLESKIPKS